MCSCLGGGDEGVRGGVGVVPGGKVPVEGCDDGVLLPLLHVTPEPNEQQTHTQVMQGHSMYIQTYFFATHLVQLV